MEIDIESKLQKDFKSNFKEAKKLLELFEDRNQLGARVTRSIVVLSKGNIDILISKIEEAEEDWRDIVEDAENFSFEFNNPFEEN